MPFSAWRFWNTCTNKNEKQLTPAGIYVSCSLRIKVHIYTQQEEQPSNLLLRTWIFQIPKSEQSFSAFLYVLSPVNGLRLAAILRVTLQS